MTSMDAKEIIVTNPITGGKKGMKLARYDLVPVGPLIMTVGALPTIAHELKRNDQYSQMQHKLWGFWNRDIDLFQLASACAHMFHLLSDYGVEKSSNSSTVPPFDLMPEDALYHVAELYGSGVNSGKYEARNWEKGYAWSLSFAACQRHIRWWRGGEIINPENGVPHLAASIFHCFAILEFSFTHPELDDRPNKIQA